MIDSQGSSPNDKQPAIATTLSPTGDDRAADEAEARTTSEGHSGDINMSSFSQTTSSRGSPVAHPQEPNEDANTPTNMPTASGDDGYQSDNEDEHQARDELLQGSGPSRGPISDELRATGVKRSLQASRYLLLIQDHLEALEQDMRKIQDQPKPPDSEDIASQRSEPEALLCTPALLKWQEFHSALHERLLKPQSTVDILVEKPYSAFSSRRAISSVHVREGQQVLRAERVRLNSWELSEYFSKELGLQNLSLTGLQHLRPFKAIVLCANALRAKTDELEKRAPVEPQGVTTADGEILHAAEECGPKTATDGRSIHQNVDADISEQPKEGTFEDDRVALQHYQCLVNSFSKGLAHELDTHYELTSRYISADPINEPTKVRFSDLWHLFSPGDLVYEPLSTQALRVLAVNGGRVFLENDDLPTYDTWGNRGRESPVNGRPQRLTLGGTVSDFVLTCFYLDFNGEFVGPVQVEKRIEPLKG